MVFEEDRGTIVRITFDIVYPTKQMKTVAMNMSQSDNWSDVGIIAFDKETIERILIPGLNELKKNNVEEDILKLWETRQIIDREKRFKPAMLLVDKEGTVTPKCGTHRSTSYMEKDNPVASFI